jgi:acetyl esterase/lipase
MTSLAQTTLIVLMVIILSACTTPTKTQSTALPTTPPLDLIKPGETFNGILVTTGSGDSTFSFDLPCKQENGAWKCPVPCGTTINPLATVYDPENNADNLNTIWDTMVYTATIEGRPVDLEAFGTVDFVHQQSGFAMRAYNLALQRSQPAEVTVVDKGILDGKEFGYAVIISFEPAAAAQDPIQPLSSAAERPGQHPYRSEKTSFELLLYLPDEYGKDPQQTWPLILFLHGEPNVTSLDQVRTEPLAVQLDDQLEFPFIVASPLHTGEYEHLSQPAAMDDLMALTAELQGLFAINPQQVYLAGFIEGANGVWNLALAQPKTFAAIVPAGGYTGYSFRVPENICALKEVPIWAFHGAGDPDIPASAQQMLVDALKDCGNEAVQFTIYPDVYNHEMIFTAFSDPDLYTWLLEQSK